MTNPSPPTPMADRLYELLPAVYRIRDGDRAEQLRKLLEVIGEQLQLVEDDINRLYDNWFIETCEDWVIPYLGDLVGYRPAGVPATTQDPRVSAGRSLLPAVYPRSAVANVVRARRRKGTLALLEELAADLGGWPARAVEFYRMLGVTQPVGLLGTSDAVPQVWRRRGRTLDVRDGEALDLAHGPFDSLAHTVDVRRPTSRGTTGRYGIPSVGVFAWRLRPYSVTGTPALCLEDEDPHRYTFSILGNSAPLFAHSIPELGPTDIADEANLPVPIRRRALQRHPDRFVGAGKSLQINIGDPAEPVSAERVVAADLGGWQQRPLPGDVLVDPERGLMLFSHDRLPATGQGVSVCYSYGFSADLGGGEYERPLSGHPDAVITTVRGEAQLDHALGRWRGDAEPGKRRPRHEIVEIDDSGVYHVAARLHIGADSSLQLRAGQRRRPIIRLPDRSTGPDALRVTGEEGSRFTLDGLMIVSNAMQVDGDLIGLTLRHCTLVPGWGLGLDCEPTYPARPSLELIDASPDVCIEHSIVGSIQARISDVRRDPVRLCVSDSIVDATSRARAAVAGLGGGRAHVTASLVRSTVIGEVLVHAIALAENSILDGRVEVARRQVGCVRFCSVVPGSRTPRRFQCQPDLVDALVDATHDPGEERERARESERLRVHPAFSSVRYGTPDYCQLSPACADEIAQGAEDESEMGVFHDLYQPQRAAALRSALADYSPAGADSALIFAN